MFSQTPRSSHPETLDETHEFRKFRLRTPRGAAGDQAFRGTTEPQLPRTGYPPTFGEHMPAAWASCPEPAGHSDTPVTCAGVQEDRCSPVGFRRDPHLTVFSTRHDSRSSAHPGGPGVTRPGGCLHTARHSLLGGMPQSPCPGLPRGPPTGVQTCGSPGDPESLKSKWPCVTDCAILCQ